MSVKPATQSNSIAFVALFLMMLLFFCIFCFTDIYTVSPLPDNKPILVIENMVLSEETPFIIENNHVLLSYNIIKEYLDPYIFWDLAESKVTITTLDKTVRLATESLTAMINTKPTEISLPAKILAAQQQPYIPIRLLEDLYGIKVKVIQDKNRVIIDKNLNTHKIGKIISDETIMKLSPTWLSASVAKIKKSDNLTVYSLEDGWFQVRTEDGLIGYILKNHLEVSEMPEMTERKPDYRRYSPGRGRLNMVWDYIYKVTPDKSMESVPLGLDIISPTWFSIIDGQGTIDSKADIAYIEWAHKNNLAVWPLINNNFDPDITHEFLSSSETRDKIIRQILMYAELFRLDGINLDFENVYLEDKGLLVQFVRELVPILHEAGIVVSMDVTVKSTSPNWSMCYDRKELGKVVDYVILMAYDEHWATSPISGSVASIGWVEKGIATLLEDVPPEKVILGLPFYTRQWEEVSDDGGNTTVKSTALSMAQVKEILEKNEAKISWDEKAGQNFAYYKKGDSVFKIWLEDEKSIKLKAALIEKYGLAGAAAWRKGFEEPEIWDVLYSSLKLPSKI
ncbi:glycosyl hydrolase family 18 protein [Tepidanaerobacter sp. EBM-38]|uniref:glycosyl hydrolase family 18 protein n=1 Tax=Tepidanaerobacter sp. EBM-38 TaxID=1918496 RepID=UPI000A7B11A6|nr:glycosyl hydrolase family 18 protein [Tepidanaerobacter sp. EBM-38]